MGRGDDWEQAGPAERAAGYAGRMSLLAELTADVRAHRAEECAMAPLCPGRVAAGKVNGILPHDMGDFVTSCLARMADQDGEIESLRVALEQEQARVKTLRQDLATSEREADAGWVAYRQMADRVRATGITDVGQP